MAKSTKSSPKSAPKSPKAKAAIAVPEFSRINEFIGQRDGKPVQVFECGPVGNRFNFSFGRRNAGLLLQAIEEVGFDHFKATLEEFIASK